MNSISPTFSKTTGTYDCSRSSCLETSGYDPFILVGVCRFRMVFVAYLSYSGAQWRHAKL